MSLTTGLRLFLILLGLLGLTVTGLHGLSDLRDDHDGPVSGSAKVSESSTGVGYGLVDVEKGIRPIPSPLTGRVKRVWVKVNNRVKAGDRLVSLDDTVAKLRVRQARAEMDDAQLQLNEARQGSQRYHEQLEQQKSVLKSARFARDKASRGKDKLQELFEKEISNIKDVLDANDVLKMLEQAVLIQESRMRELEMSDPALAEARARKLVEAKQVQLELAEHELQLHELRAPESGTILSIFVREGDLCSSSTSQPVLELCPDQPRIVRAEVSQEWVSRLKRGQKVTLQDDEDPSLHWDGEVRRVSDRLMLNRSVWPGMREMHDQRTAECIIEPKLGTQQLRIGQKVRVLLAASGR